MDVVLIRYKAGPFGLEVALSLVRQGVPFRIIGELSFCPMLTIRSHPPPSALR